MADVEPIYSGEHLVEILEELGITVSLRRGPPSRISVIG